MIAGCESEIGSVVELFVELSYPNFKVHVERGQEKGFPF